MRRIDGSLMFRSPRGNSQHVAVDAAVQVDSWTAITQRARWILMHSTRVRTLTGAAHVGCCCRWPVSAVGFHVCWSGFVVAHAVVRAHHI